MKDEKDETILYGYIACDKIHNKGTMRACNFLSHKELSRTHLSRTSSLLMLIELHGWKIFV